MGTFMAAYLAVWLGVVAFVFRLGVKQRQLQKSLDALQTDLRYEETSDENARKAA